MTNPYMNLSEEELERNIAAMKSKKTENPYMDMSEEELEANIASLRSQPEERSMSDTLMRGAARKLKSLSVGLRSIKDTPNYLAMGLHAAGLKETPEFYPSYAQEEENRLNEYADRQGVNLRAETPFEEAEDAVIQGGAPMLITGGASALATGVKSGIKAGAKQAVKGASSKVAAANAGSSLGAHTYHKNVENPGFVGTMIAAAAGGKAGKAARGLHTPITSVKNTAAKVANKITKFNPNEYSKLKDLMPISMADTSDRKWARGLENTATYIPGSQGVLEKFHSAKENALSRNLGLGSKETASSIIKNPATHLVKEGAKGTKDTVNKVLGKFEGELHAREEKAINNRELVDVAHIQEMVKKNKKGLLTEGELHDFSKTPYGELEKTLSDYDVNAGRSLDINSLRKQGISENVIKQLSDKLGGGNKVGYGGFKALLKETLNKKRKAVRGTTEYGDLSQINRSLRGTKHEWMDKNGTPTERSASRQFNAFYSKYADKNKSNMKHYVNDLLNTDNDVNAFNKIRKDNRYTKAALLGLEKDKRPVLAQSIMADMGADGSKFNIHKFSEDWHGTNKDVRNTILRSRFNPQERANFKATMDYVDKNQKSVKNISKLSEPDSKWLKSSKIGGVAASLYAAPATTVTAYLAAKGGAKLWTNQDFLARMNDMSKAKKPLTKARALEKLKNLPIVQSAFHASQQENRKKKIPLIDIGKGKYVPDSER